MITQEFGMTIFLYRYDDIIPVALYQIHSTSMNAT